MSKYLGDFAAGDTVDFKFSTFRPSTGAAYTLGGTPAISVYKSNSTTQTTSGVTLTADFDSVTGLHHVRIDTTADGTFYADGGQFEAVITTGTVDSVSVVGACVGRFTLRAQAPLYPTTAGRKLDVSAGGEAGLDWANVGSPTTTVGLSGTTISTSQTIASVSGAVGSVTGAVGSVTGNVGGNVVGSVASVTGAVASVTGNVGGNVVGSVGSVSGAVGSVTGAVGSVTGNVGGNVVGSVASVTGAVGSVTASVTVGTNNDKTGYALSSAGVQAIWDALTSALTTVGSIGKRIVDNLDVVLSTRLASASYTTPPTAAAIADAVWDETTSGHTTNGTTGKALTDAASGGGGGASGTTIRQGPFRLKESSELTDDTITTCSVDDVLDIELTLIDGGSPVDNSGATLAASFVNARTGVELSTPTVTSQYDTGGIVTVAITATETAAAGTYHLTVTQTAGLSTITFGPHKVIVS